MAAVGLSDRVRSLVGERYVQPALKAGKNRLSIGVKDVLNDSAMGDFPRFRTPVICQALLGNKLLTQYGLEIESVDGPPSKLSRTVVVHYRVVHGASASAPLTPAVQKSPIAEDPAARAKRLTEKLRGLLKQELAEYGGAEGFMRWIRSDQEDDAA
jgi:hypothetical protein